MSPVLCVHCNLNLARPQSWYCSRACEIESEYEQLILSMPVVIPT